MTQYGVLDVIVKDVKLIQLPKELETKRFIEYYVEVYMGAHLRKTQPTSSLEWNEQFSFDFSTQNRLDFVMKAIHDKGETIVGSTEMNIQSLRDMYQPMEVEETQPLYNVSINSGELVLLLTYVPNLSRFGQPAQNEPIEEEEERQFEEQETAVEED